LAGWRRSADDPQNDLRTGRIEGVVALLLSGYVLLINSGTLRVQLSVLRGQLSLRRGSRCRPSGTFQVLHWRPIAHTRRAIGSVPCKHRQRE